jgi:hypothetical protein
MYNQRNLPANSMRKYLCTYHVTPGFGDSPAGAPVPSFPLELRDVGVVSPSPSGMPTLLCYPFSPVTPHGFCYQVHQVCLALLTSTILFHLSDIKVIGYASHFDYRARRVCLMVLPIKVIVHASPFDYQIYRVYLNSDMTKSIGCALSHGY